MCYYHSHRNVLKSARAYAVLFSLSAVLFSAEAQTGKTTPQTPLTTVVVEKAITQPNTVDRRLIGQVEAIDTVDIQPRVSGNLMNIRFKEGEIVNRGDLLFEIEDTQYKAKVKTAKAQIAQIDAKKGYAETTLERYQRLVKSASVSQDTVDNSKSVLDTLVGERKSAEAELTMAEDNLNYTKIISPIKGRIGRLTFSQGNYITPQSGSLATVTKLDEVYVRFPISSKDFLSLFGNGENMKNQAVIRLGLADGKPYELTGDVTLVDNKVQSTDSINIWAKFNNPDEKLIPGGIVTVHLSKKDVEQMTSIPLSAIVHRTDKSYVYVLDANNVVEQREVILDTMVNNRQFIRKGLKEGEIVIVDGMHKTAPGRTVQPVYSKK